jgi:hypothetical protein
MRTSEMIGSKKVWMLYNRDNLPDLILNPPLSVRTSTNPIPGTKVSSASGTRVTILHAQYPSWSHGRVYPVTPNEIMMIARIIPVTQISSLGLFKPPVR